MAYSTQRTQVIDVWARCVLPGVELRIDADCCDDAARAGGGSELDCWVEGWYDCVCGVMFGSGDDGLVCCCYLIFY